MASVWAQPLLAPWSLPPASGPAFPKCQPSARTAPCQTAASSLCIFQSQNASPGPTSPEPSEYTGPEILRDLNRSKSHLKFLPATKRPAKPATAQALLEPALGGNLSSVTGSSPVGWVGGWLLCPLIREPAASGEGVLVADRDAFGHCCERTRWEGSSHPKSNFSKLRLLWDLRG